MATEAQSKRISVTFAGDDDVVHHIYSMNARKGSFRAGRKKKAEYEGSGSESDQPEEDKKDSQESQDSSQDEIFRPSEALSEGQILSGGDVFGFMSKKRSSQMTAAASRSAQAVSAPLPGTPPKQARDSQSGQPVTPKSILKKTRAHEILAETGQTPVNKRSMNRVKRLAATTPHRVRARNRAGSSSEDSVSSDSADDEDLASDEETSDSTPVKTQSQTKTDAKTQQQSQTKTDAKTQQKPAAAKTKQRKQRDVDDTVKTVSVEAYFDAHSSSSVLTSDRTLSRLETPRMDHQALSAVLSGVTTDLQDEKRSLLDDYTAQFNKWMFLLCHGYNLLFHGLGSKRSLLEEFRTTMIGDFHNIVVNGYFPSLTIKMILSAITEDILDYSGTFRTPIEHCDFIRKHYECGEQEDFFLVIHNIDGPMLRGEKTQTILSLLGQIRGFHVIASIDHINAPLMWDNTKCCRFNWLWYDVTTYESYADETSYENSLMVQQSGALALSSLTHVMRSLTPNAKGIFLLLVRHQLENAKDNSSYQGLSFPDLYQKCREAFLVNSDQTLKTQLTEFKDHKLIKLKKGMDGVEYLNIPLDPATLQEFLEQQESEGS